MRGQLVTNSIGALIGLTLFTAGMTREAHAVSITIDNVAGTWSNVLGGQNVTNAGGTLSWGNPAPGVKSSYDFVGAAPPVQGPYLPGSVFSLGNFTHNNFPIPSGSAITGATLNLTIDFSLDAVAQTALLSSFVFTHNETPNSSPCGFPSVSVCDDIVTAVTNVGGGTAILLNGVEYVFAFSAFQYNNQNLTQFFTQEGLSNTASLLGTFIEKERVPGEVPIPAALPLFASGLGGMGVLAWRRRRSTKSAA